MSLLDDARRLAGDPPLDTDACCSYCEAYHGNLHAPDCPWLAMPRIVAAIEERDRMLESMARVWGKAAAALAEGTDNRAEYKHYAEMADILYHVTNGQQGACSGGCPRH